MTRAEFLKRLTIVIPVAVIGGASSLVRPKIPRPLFRQGEVMTAGRLNDAFEVMIRAIESRHD